MALAATSRGQIILRNILLISKSHLTIAIKKIRSTSTKHVHSLSITVDWTNFILDVTYVSFNFTMDVTHAVCRFVLPGLYVDLTVLHFLQMFYNHL
jgi:hypothetical protein